jgi:hypothetical protein
MGSNNSNIRFDGLEIHHQTGILSFLLLARDGFVGGGESPHLQNCSYIILIGFTFGCVQHNHLP